MIHEIPPLINKLKPNKMMRQKIIFSIAILLIMVGIFTPDVATWMPGIAIFLGIIVSVVFGNPFQKLSIFMGKKGLNYAVIGLGFGMNVVTVYEVGKEGLLWSIIGICVAMGLGALFGKLFKLSANLTTLISAGTAICGGSAIAATSQVIDADHHETTLSTAVVFILNAVALLIFPQIGYLFHLTESQFGEFCALAIHDTSSVVGATAQYGATALEVGTAVKLSRALWIIPLAFSIAMYKHLTSKEEGKLRKIQIPWFIFFFILASASVTLFPVFEPTGKELSEWAKHLMILTLFFIGSNISREKLTQMGLRPMFMGIALWVIMTILWFLIIY